MASIRVGLWRRRGRRGRTAPYSTRESVPRRNAVVAEAWLVSKRQTRLEAGEPATTTGRGKTDAPGLGSCPRTGALAQACVIRPRMAAVPVLAEFHPSSGPSALDAH